MADNKTPTEVRRARGLDRYANTCNICGGHFDRTPNGKFCGTGCKIEPTPVAKGPYSKEERKALSVQS